MPHSDHTRPEGKGKETGRKLGRCKTQDEEKKFKLGEGMGESRKSKKGKGLGRRLKSSKLFER